MHKIRRSRKAPLKNIPLWFLLFCLLQNLSTKQRQENTTELKTTHSNQSGVSHIAFLCLSCQFIHHCWWYFYLTLWFSPCGRWTPGVHLLLSVASPKLPTTMGLIFFSPYWFIYITAENMHVWLLDGWQPIPEQRKPGKWMHSVFQETIEQQEVWRPWNNITSRGKPWTDKISLSKYI